MTFLQQIARGLKKHYLEHEVKRRVIPTHEEFSVSVILKHGYCSAKMVQDYFPKTAEIVNRQWLWEVWLTYDETAADKYFKAVRASKLKPEIPKPFKMVFDEEWLDRLLKFDCKSKFMFLDFDDMFL